ncbi:MAG: hypothetical protein ACPG31_10050 [Planctomycetota bacterium]
MPLPIHFVFLLAATPTSADFAALQEPEVVEEVVSEVEASEEPEPFLKRFSAARRDNHWRTRKKEGETRNGDYYFAGWASEELLRVLEEIYAGPRVCVNRSYLLMRRMGGVGGHGCRPPFLIRVQFEEHPELALTFDFSHDQLRISGESSYRLEVTEEQRKILTAMEHWLPPENGPEGSFPESSSEPLPWHEALKVKGSFVSPLSHEEDAAPANLIKAECFRTRTVRDPQNPAVPKVVTESIGLASDRMITVLQSYLHGPRYSTIRRWPSGRQEDFMAQSTVRNWIECTMDDGQVVWMQHYPDQGIWKVKGEGAYRLNVKASESLGLMAGIWWDKE